MCDPTWQTERHVRGRHTEIRYCTCRYETVVANEDTPRHCVLTLRGTVSWQLSPRKISDELITELTSLQTWCRNTSRKLSTYGARLKELTLSPPMIVIRYTNHVLGTLNSDALCTCGCEWLPLLYSTDWLGFITEIVFTARYGLNL